MPMVQDKDLEGTVMFTRSIPGCGILAGPSPELEGFLSLRLKGSTGSAGLNLTSRHAAKTRKARKRAADEI